MHRSCRRRLLPPPGFDALLIADGGQRVSAIAALLAYYDISPANVALLGTMRWQDDAGLLRDAGLQGALLASWPPDELAQFERRFADVYGRSPAPLAVLAYDATASGGAAGAGASRASPAPRSATRKALSAAPASSGCGPNGLADHGLAVVEIEAGGLRVVDPAPRLVHRQRRSASDQRSAGFNLKFTMTLIVRYLQVGDSQRGGDPGG